MKPVRPQALVHRGVVPAAAFWFGPPITEAMARERILALWTPGATVYRFRGGLLLRLPAPRRTDSAHAVGVPLVRQGDVFTAAPLRPQELAALAPPPDAVVLLVGGIATAETPSAAAVEDPATWLDLGAFVPLAPEAFGEPAAPRVVAEPVVFPARARFQGVPDADPALPELLAELRGDKVRSKGPSLLDRGLAAVIKPLLSSAVFRAWLGIGTTPGTSTTTAARRGGHGEPTPGQPARPRRNPLAEQLQWLAARFLQRTGLGAWVGRRQARYLARMMALFERGDLHEALRYAVPLGNGGIEQTPPPPPALGVPTPRQDLRLTTQPSGSGGGAFYGDNLYNSLQAMYRRAYERLVADGKIEEAAFVLADLLQEIEEAVTFLERHQKYALAAELAEGHELPPGLVVRQWFVAGNAERAVQIARRTGAFADAVLRLERTDAERAKVLRTLWAQSQARAGDYAGAVQVIWPVKEARHVATEWMRRGATGGGASGGLMLACLLTVEDTLENWQRSVELLEDESPERAEERSSFTNALRKEPGNGDVRPLFRLAARALWRDAAHGWSTVDRADFRLLLGAAGDGTLRADMPPLAPLVRVPLAQRTHDTPTIALAAEDRGALALADAAYLPSGASLVALGEAGTRLVGRDGRTLVHWDHPAHRLVVADNGNQAIGLARRGSVWRLTHFDLIARRATPWCEAALRAFAPDYDGSLWFVAVGSDFLAIDATKTGGFEALWRTPNIEGRIVAIARDTERCSFLLHNAGDTDGWGRPAEPWETWNRWMHVLPSLTLRDRAEVTLNGSPDTRMTAAAVSPGGSYGAIIVSGELGETTVLHYEVRDAVASSDKLTVGQHVYGTTGIASHLSDNWLVTVSRSPDATHCQLMLPKPVVSYQRCAVTLYGAEHACVRLTQQTLTIGDDAGRLLVLSLTDGTLLRNLRLA